MVLVLGLAMFAGGTIRLPQLADKIPPLCYLHHASFLRYVLEAFYLAEASKWAPDISVMCVVPSFCGRAGVTALLCVYGVTTSTVRLFVGGRASVFFFAE